MNSTDGKEQTEHGIVARLKNTSFIGRTHNSFPALSTADVEWLLRELASLRSRLAEAERERDVARRALESFTPSGSEFVNDVKRCSEFIRERITKEHEMLVKAVIDRKAVESRLAEVEKERDAQWVSVEERLPELGDYVQISVTGYRYPITARYKRTGYFTSVPGAYGYRDSVTHWRPLPEPPGAALGRDKGMEGK